MSVTNNNLKVIDLPMLDIMAPNDWSGSFGTYSQSYCNDLRGSDRYFYTTLGVQFGRYDTWANCWQRLPDAPATSSNYNTLVFVPSYGTSGGVYAWTNLTNFYVFDIGAMTWTSKAATPVTLGALDSNSLCHTATAYNAGGNDDYIYLASQASANVYRYSISANTWTTLAAGNYTPAAGSRLVWLPGSDADKLIRWQGSSSWNCEKYSISGNTWTTMSLKPNTETPALGDYFCPRGSNFSTMYWYHNCGTAYYMNKIMSVDPASGQIAPVAPVVFQSSGSGNSAYGGNKLLYVNASGIEFLYCWLYSQQSLFRIPLVF
jgi:hypothetical protein